MAEKYDVASERGYWGIGIYASKFESNLGCLWRSAHNFGADFVFTIGKRYKIQRSDTTKAYKHIPLFEYEDWDSFTIPKGARLVGVEKSPIYKTKTIYNYKHPNRAIYLLGAEDTGLPLNVLKRCNDIIEIPSTKFCINVANTGSIIMYDRKAKENAS